jgi:hypothetical protein
MWLLEYVAKERGQGDLGSICFCIVVKKARDCCIFRGVRNRSHVWCYFDCETRESVSLFCMTVR